MNCEELSPSIVTIINDFSISINPGMDYNRLKLTISSFGFGVNYNKVATSISFALHIFS